MNLHRRIEQLERAAPARAENADAIRARIVARLDGIRARLTGDRAPLAPPSSVADVRAMLHARLVALGVRSDDLPPRVG